MRLYLLFTIFLQFSHVNSQSNHLLLVVSDLKTLAGLMNGLLLRAEFQEKHFHLDEFVAELLGFDSVDSFQNLMKTPTDTISSSLKDFETKIQDFPSSNMTLLSNLLTTVKFFDQLLADWSDIKGAYVFGSEYIDPIKEEWKIKFSVFSQALDFGHASGIIDNLNAIFSAKTTSEVISPLSKLKEHLNKTEESFDVIVALNEKPTQFFNLPENNGMMETIRKCVKATRQYSQIYQTLVDSPSDFDAFQSASSDFPQISNEHASVKLFSKTLKEVVDATQSITKKRNYYFEGFPNGVTDLRSLFFEFDRGWISSTFSGESRNKTVLELLNPLRAFTGDLVELNNFWRQVKNGRDRKNVGSLVNWMMRAAEDGGATEEMNNLKSATFWKKCISGLRELVDWENSEFKLFETNYDNYAFIYSNIQDLKDVVKEIVQFKGVKKSERGNIQKLRSVIVPLSRDVETIKQASQVISKIKKVENFREVEQLYRNLTKKSSFFSNLTERFSIYGRYMDEEFSTTIFVDKILISSNLDPVIECLTNEVDEFKKVKHWLELMEAVDFFKKHQTTFSTIYSMLEQLKGMQKVWENLSKTFESVNKRSLTKALKPKHLRQLTENFSGGVRILVNLMRVYQDRLLIEELIEQGKKVEGDLAKVWNSHWTEESEKGIQKLLNQLIGLSYRSEDLRGGNDILKTGMIFQEAIQLKGVPIDMKTLIKQLTDHFGKSGGYEVQTFIRKLQRLQHLQLDYSSSIYPLKAAHHALLDVRKYFDELLREDPVTTSETPEVAVATEKVEKPVLSVFQWILVGMGVFTLGGIAVAVYYCITEPF